MSKRSKNLVGMATGEPAAVDGDNGTNSQLMRPSVLLQPGKQRRAGSSTIAKDSQPSQQKPQHKPHPQPQQKLQRQQKPKQQQERHPQPEPQPQQKPKQQQQERHPQPEPQPQQKLKPEQKPKRQQRQENTIDSDAAYNSDSSFTPSELALLNSDWIVRNTVSDFISSPESERSPLISPVTPILSPVANVDKVKQWLFKEPSTTDKEKLTPPETQPTIAPAGNLKRPGQRNIPHGVIKTPDDNNNNDSKEKGVVGSRKELFPDDLLVPMDLRTNQPPTSEPPVAHSAVENQLEPPNDFTAQIQPAGVSAEIQVEPPPADSAVEIRPEPHIDFMAQVQPAGVSAEIQVEPPPADSAVEIRPEPHIDFMAQIQPAGVSAEIQVEPPATVEILSSAQLESLLGTAAEVVIETVDAWAEGENPDAVVDPEIIIDSAFLDIEQMGETVDEDIDATDEAQVNGAAKPARKRNTVVSEQTPPKKRKLNPSQWKSALRKKSVNSGQEYINYKGQKRSARRLKPGCGAKCRRKCGENITEEKRLELFNRFWSLKDKMLQWFFISKLVSKVPIKRRRVPVVEDEDSFRKSNYEYSLGDPATDELKPVCRTMFINTFDISITVVKSALTKNSPDKRGTHDKSRRRIPTELVENVREHIRQFPVIKSHYCRSDTRKRYLDTHLNVAKMHRMYLSEREPDAPFTATLRQYRDIFNTSFNLGFFKPKKDRCADCVAWESLPEEEQTGAKLLKQNTHIQDKELVRDMRRNDKTVSRETDKTLVVATFDMQSVFFCPKTEISGAFYKSKISCYNFTVYNCTEKDGACYVWDMTVGGKGADEIASFLFNWIEDQVVKGKKVFHFYSDSCGPQNKNQFLYSMYYLAVMKFQITICHRYLVRGHTQMECDSVHARIEKKTKRQEVFTPSQWYGLIKTAKVKKPAYKVIEVKRENILSYRPLAVEFNWANHGVSTLREITLSNSTPGKALLKRDLKSEAREVAILIPRRGRPFNWTTYKPNAAYAGRLALKAQVKKSIRWFINSGKIPAAHVPFYESLLEPAPEIEAPDSSDDEDEPEVTNSGDVYEDDDEDDPAELSDNPADEDDDEDDDNEDGNTTDSDAYD